MIHITQSVLGQITEIFNKRKKAIHLDNYEVGDILDHGGMSNIYSLTDASGKVGYVLRVSEEHKSPYSNDIFNVRELKILQELKKNSQPHVVQYMDAFAVDVPGYPRYYCAVMKFLCTLKQYRVNGDGVEIAVRLGGDFLPLLQSFTDKSILHRDIKPANIFYDADFRNETGFLLGDFGIAKRDTDTSVTPTGTELRISDVSSDENNGKNERETEAVKRLMARGQKHIVYFLMNFTVETTYGEERHTLYCTLMPFLCSLLKYENKADDIEIAVRLGNDLLPLLQTCMEKQIIHRDIKSGNILYDGDGTQQAVLIRGRFRLQYYIKGDMSHEHDRDYEG